VTLNIFYIFQINQLKSETESCKKIYFDKKVKTKTENLRFNEMTYEVSFHVVTMPFYLCTYLYKQNLILCI
jgi:hypothetical protein